jgi:hypothetical protein
MLTILEGPDGGGKTCFAETLTSQPGSEAVTYDHGPYLEHAEIARLYWPMIERALVPPRQEVLADRSWLAEPVYGDAYRGGANRLPVAHRRLLERAALAAHAVVGFFLPPAERCAETFLRRLDREYLPDVSALACTTATSATCAVSSSWTSRTRCSTTRATITARCGSSSRRSAP